MKDLIKVLSLGFALYGMESSAQTVSGQIAGHDYVDLGLPSGTLWATYNVGATKPTEYGYYLAWGETEPKEYYDWNNYKLCTKSPEGYLSAFTKYCTDSDYGTVDNRYFLENIDDAATVNWGKNWRMPSGYDLHELHEGCKWERVTDFNGSGVNGQLGTSKVNGNTIFLPAAGSISKDGEPYGDGGVGNYWTADLRSSATFNAYRLYFIGESILEDYNSRQLGYSVRAVSTSKPTVSATISILGLQVFAESGTIHITNAQPNTNIQVFDMNGKAIATSVTDGYGNAEVSAAKGVYVVTVGNMSTKVILK